MAGWHFYSTRKKKIRTGTIRQNTCRAKAKGNGDLTWSESLLNLEKRWYSSTDHQKLKIYETWREYQISWRIWFSTRIPENMSYTKRPRFWQFSWHTMLLKCLDRRLHVSGRSFSSEPGYGRTIELLRTDRVRVLYIQFVVLRRASLAVVVTVPQLEAGLRWGSLGQFLVVAFITDILQLGVIVHW